MDSCKRHMISCFPAPAAHQLKRWFDPRHVWTHVQVNCLISQTPFLIHLACASLYLDISPYGSDTGIYRVKLINTMAVDIQVLGADRWTAAIKWLCHIGLCSFHENKFQQPATFKYCWIISKAHTLLCSEHNSTPKIWTYPLTHDISS